MIIQPNEQSLRQTAITRFARAAELLHCHTREAKLKALLATVILALLAIATLFGLHLVI